MRGPSRPAEATRDGAHPAAAAADAPGIGLARHSRPRREAGPGRRRRTRAKRARTRPTPQPARSSAEQHGARLRRHGPGRCRPGSNRPDRGEWGGGEDGYPKAVQSDGATVDTSPPGRADGAAIRREKASLPESAPYRSRVRSESDRTPRASPQSTLAPHRGPRASCFEPSDPETQHNAKYLECRGKRNEDVPADHRFIEDAQELRAHKAEIEVHTGDDHGEEPDLRPLPGRARTHLVGQLDIELDR